MLYFVIGDPLALGLAHVITALSATTLVIGATGFEGTVATKIVTMLEYNERP